MPPINHTLVDQTVLIDGVPIDIGAKAKGSANSFFSAGYGPVTLQGRPHRDQLGQTDDRLEADADAARSRTPFSPKSVSAAVDRDQGLGVARQRTFTMSQRLHRLAGAEASLGVARTCSSSLSSAAA